MQYNYKINYFFLIILYFFYDACTKKSEKYSGPSSDGLFTISEEGNFSIF